MILAVNSELRVSLRCWVWGSLPCPAPRVECSSLDGPHAADSPVLYGVAGLEWDILVHRIAEYLVGGAKWL